MEKMGFKDRWIQLIYECISSVSYSILVNGEPHGDIQPTRGLRQGDPLSPYLFLLVSEGLNGLIQQAMAAGDIRGFSLCRNGPQISHLFFADDTLLFCRAELRENAIKNLLGVPEIKEYERYLGLTAVVGNNRRACLNYIHERVWGNFGGVNGVIEGRYIGKNGIFYVNQNQKGPWQSSIPYFGVVDATVDQLIDSDSRWWNTSLVDSIFLTFEAQLIKSIPVCHSAQEDFPFCLHSRTGMYQVHSGYNLLCALNSSDVASSSDTVEQKKFWNSLWKLDVPNKVKVFLWRACTNSILTMLNLHKRRIVSSSVFSLCREGEESVLHALWSCEGISSVWGSCFASLRSEFSKVSSFSDLLDLVFCSLFISEVFAMTCWAIWNCRNKVRDFQQVCLCSSKKVRSRRPRWKLPNVGFVKVNFDGAIFEGLKAAGIGVAVRNEHGEVVAALAEQIPIPDSVFTLETLAARRVVHFVWQLGLHNVVFEGDSESSIHAIRNRLLLHSSCGHII
ncbi:uncharacterized protein LOC142616302 [Castanea sativa]|uniref:uncharacterized protein LOC142616302 n=1 Tax=Castanea sativa TaxID=21020 RepID=UPI003F650824